MYKRIRAYFALGQQGVSGFFMGWPDKPRLFARCGANALRHIAPPPPIVIFMEFFSVDVLQ
jgi:hypothetical protein